MLLLLRNHGGAGVAPPLVVRGQLRTTGYDPTTPTGYRRTSTNGYKPTEEITP